MNYDEVVSASFIPTPEGVVAEPTRRSSTARRLRDAIEPIAMHPVWSRQTNEALAALGLDFLSGYVRGRAAALGEPSPSVVVSSFAVFEPAMISDPAPRRRARSRPERTATVRGPARPRPPKRSHRPAMA